MNVLDDGMTIDEALADAQTATSVQLPESAPVSDIRFVPRAVEEEAACLGAPTAPSRTLRPDVHQRIDHEMRAVQEEMAELEERLAMCRRRLDAAQAEQQQFRSEERRPRQLAHRPWAERCDDSTQGFYFSPAYERCSAKSRTLLETLVRQEQRTERSENHIHLVLLASTLIEAEMGALLAEPAREVVRSILDAQIAHNPKYKTEALEGWTEKKVSTSLGIEIMILCGLRWGILQERRDILDFLDRHFNRGYVRLARDIRLAAAVDAIRAEYRNPAHHGERVEYGRRDFSELCRLVSGKTSFSRWLPNPGRVRGPDVGVLHNHLILRKGTNHLPDSSTASCPTPQ